MCVAYNIEIRYLNILDSKTWLCKDSDLICLLLFLIIIEKEVDF